MTDETSSDYQSQQFPLDTEITLILDMEPEEFASLRTEFHYRLSTLLNVDPSEIEIIGHRVGCTKVRLRMSDPIAKLLFASVNDQLHSSEEFVEFLIHYRVKKAVFSEHQVLYRRCGREFTWLHLSDAHWELSDRAHAGSQDRVKKALLDELRDILDEDDLIPNAVFITGDITMSGQAAEFMQSREFFEKLRDSLPQKDIPFMFVPGNHDVDRSTVKRFYREEQDAQRVLANNESIIDYLSSKKHKDDRDRMFARTANYSEFIQECGSLGQPPLNHGYFFTHTLEHERIRIGIAGMSSAWRSGSDEDRGRLILGIPQIDACLEAVRDADLRILLVHHPVESDWFIRDDVLYQRSRLDSFDFILRGHEHDPNTISTNQIEKNPNFRLSAGALYTHERYPKSFNAVRLNLDGNSARVFYWRLSTSKFEWVRDLDFHRDGSVQFPYKILERQRTKDRIRANRPPSTVPSQADDQDDRPSR